MAAAASPKPKAGKPVTTRHLAAALWERRRSPKSRVLQMLENLIGMITERLKKGEQSSRSPALASWWCASAPPAWAVTR